MHVSHNERERRSVGKNQRRDERSLSFHRGSGGGRGSGCDGGGGYLVQGGEHEDSSLAHARLGLADYVHAQEGLGDALVLHYGDRGGAGTEPRRGGARSGRRRGGALCRKGRRKGMEGERTRWTWAWAWKGGWTGGRV